MNSLLIRGQTADLEGGLQVTPLTNSCVRINGFGWFVELTFNATGRKVEGYAEGPDGSVLHLLGKDIVGQSVDFEIVENGDA